MKSLASALSVLAFVVLLLKGFDTNGVMSAAEATERPNVLTVTRTRTVTATTTTGTKTKVFVVPGVVTTQTSSVTKAK